MNTVKALQGLLLATTAAGLFATAGFTYAAETGAASADRKIACQGANSCKGKGECKGASGCQGQNSCKGKGFIFLSEEECAAAKKTMGKHAG